MRVRLGLLREYLREAVSMTHTTSRDAPTDDDAQVPGHLPNELPPSAATDGIEEQAMVPGRWYGGEEPTGYDRERVGDPIGMNQLDIDETDDRMEDDGLGNGVKDPNDPDYDYDIADHLRGDDEKTSLGDPPDETMEEDVDVPGWMVNELRAFLMQEDPAVASGTDPTDPHGFYTPFDMNTDHMGTDDLSSTWYKSPAREPGADGDPFRVADPHARMGFHSPVGPHDSTTHPTVSGEDGVAARRAPAQWPLGAGGDPSEVIGAGAKPSDTEVGSGDEQEEEEGKSGGPGESDDEEGSEGQEQG